MTTWVGKPHLSILGGKEEDRFTQYLCELLRSPTILRAFITEACNLDVTVDETTLARTQVTVPGGRPDLAIRGKYLYLLFEAKVGAWLHEDQLRPYAQELDQWLQRQPSGTASLFVLTPQRNLTGILQSAQRELSEAGLDHIHPVGMCWEQVVVLFQTLAS
jgi:hypothetical protein